MSNVKTIAMTIINSVLGLILGTALYIGYYYTKNFMTQAVILFGLLFLVKVWRKSKGSITSNHVINPEVNESENKKAS